MTAWQDNGTSVELQREKGEQPLLYLCVLLREEDVLSVRVPIGRLQQRLHSNSSVAGVHEHVELIE